MDILRLMDHLVYTHVSVECVPTWIHDAYTLLFIWLR